MSALFISSLGLKNVEFCRICLKIGRYIGIFKRAHYESVVKLYKSIMAAPKWYENFCLWAYLTENFYSGVLKRTYYEPRTEILYPKWRMNIFVIRLKIAVYEFSGWHITKLLTKFINSVWRFRNGERNVFKCSIGTGNWYTELFQRTYFESVIKIYKSNTAALKWL